MRAIATIIGGEYDECPHSIQAKKRFGRSVLKIEYTTKDIDHGFPVEAGSVFLYGGAVPNNGTIWKDLGFKQGKTTGNHMWVYTGHLSPAAIIPLVASKINAM